MGSHRLQEARDDLDKVLTARDEVHHSIRQLETDLASSLLGLMAAVESLEETVDTLKALVSPPAPVAEPPAPVAF